MKLFITLFMLVVGLFANDCSDMYYKGYKPNVDGKSICYSEYNTIYSLEKGLVHPIFSAEKLTDKRLKLANGIKRIDTFHDEPSLSENQQATLDDYAANNKTYGKPKYDRGHLAPNKDFSNSVSQNECFSMVNMIPQTEENNRGVWSKLEAFVRHITFQNKEVYVLTGPLYDKDSKSFANGKTKVPTYVWKAIYVPSTNSGIVFISTNNKNPEIFTKNIVDFEKLVGYKLFSDSASFDELDTSEFRFDRTIKHSNSNDFFSKLTSLHKFLK